MQALFITAAQVLAELEKHVGKDQGIHVRDLVARITGLADNPPSQERRVRSLISELRETGQHICGKPESGYFMAASVAELEETCRFIRSRALSGLLVESRMRRISIPELLGQIHLSLDSTSEKAPQ